MSPWAGCGSEGVGWAAGAAAGRPSCVPQPARACLPAYLPTPSAARTPAGPCRRHRLGRAAAEQQRHGGSGHARPPHSEGHWRHAGPGARGLGFSGEATEAATTSERWAGQRWRGALPTGTASHPSHAFPCCHSSIAVCVFGPGAAGRDAPADGGGGAPRAAALLVPGLPPEPVRAWVRVPVGCPCLGQDGVAFASLGTSACHTRRPACHPTAGAARHLADGDLVDALLVCRHGYRSLEEVQGVVANHSAAGLPLEAIWTDIDLRECFCFVCLLLLLDLRERRGRGRCLLGVCSGHLL